MSFEIPEADMESCALLRRGQCCIALFILLLLSILNILKVKQNVTSGTSTAVSVFIKND